MANDPFFANQAPPIAPRAQTPQMTNPLYENNRFSGVSREELNEFLYQHSVALSQGPQGGESIPSVEASRAVIEHFVGFDLVSFDKVHFFMFQGVKVYEKGKKEEARRLESETMEQRLFGGKR